MRISRATVVLWALSVLFASSALAGNRDWDKVRFVWRLDAQAVANPFGDRLVVAGENSDEYEGEVWISDDAGKTWRMAESGCFPYVRWNALHFDPTDPHVGWVAGAEPIWAARRPS